MSKIIIMARPHPIIAGAMKEFIIRNGYEPFVLNKLEDLKNIPNNAKVYGAVISTAVDSVIKESYIEVFNEINKFYPNKPVIFTTIGKMEVITKIVSLSLSKVIKDFVIHIVDKDIKLSDLSSEKNFLIINNESITNSESREISDKVFKHYFS
jgi:hypothetical protein